MKTPYGTSVDTIGCPTENKARGALKGVVFKTASPELTETSKGILDEVAISLNEIGDVNVEVQRCTDNTGNEQANVTLSQCVELKWLE